MGLLLSLTCWCRRLRRRSRDLIGPAQLGSRWDMACPNESRAPVEISGLRHRPLPKYQEQSGTRGAELGRPYSPVAALRITSGPCKTRRFRAPPGGIPPPVLPWPHACANRVQPHGKADVGRPCRAGRTRDIRLRARRRYGDHDGATPGRKRTRSAPAYQRGNVAERRPPAPMDAPRIRGMSGHNA
jgi:hypothetical protein